MESDEKNSYTIRNVGGDIKFGNVIGEEVLIIAIYDEQYDYIGKGYILLDGFFEKDYSTYNFETNCFELYRTPDPKPIVNWMDKIENLIVEQGLFCGIECTEYFDFMYTDYKQELIQKSMVAQGEYIKDIENTDVYTFKMRVNIDDLENEQLFTEIEEQLEEFRIYKEGKN